MNVDAKKKIDLEQVIDELQQNNDLLIQMNKNLSQIVAFHQLQLAALTEAYFANDDDLTKDKPRKFTEVKANERGRKKKD